MRIKTIIDEQLRPLVDNQEKVYIRGNNIKECLDDLIRKYPEVENHIFDRNGLLMVLALHNSNMVTQKDLKKKIKEGDTLKIVLLICGG